MSVFFLACAALGATVLVLQIVGALGGLGDTEPHADAGLAEGLELFSVRGVAAALAFFGAGGLIGLSLGLGAGAAAALALAPAALALLGTAALTRQMLRLESDGSLRLDGALGVQGTVYLPVPAGAATPGKVHLVLQGRLVELQAVTREERPIPTGTPVIVVAVVDDDTVEVLPTTAIGGILDGNG